MEGAADNSGSDDDASDDDKSSTNASPPKQISSVSQQSSTSPKSPNKSPIVPSSEVKVSNGLALPQSSLTDVPISAPDFIKMEVQMQKILLQGELNRGAYSSEPRDPLPSSTAAPALTHRPIPSSWSRNEDGNEEYASTECGRIQPEFKHASEARWYGDWVSCPPPHLPPTPADDEFKSFCSH